MTLDGTHYPPYVRQLPILSPGENAGSFVGLDYMKKQSRRGYFGPFLQHLWTDFDAGFEELRCNLEGCRSSELLISHKDTYSFCSLLWRLPLLSLNRAYIRRYQITGRSTCEQVQ